MNARRDRLQIVNDILISIRDKNGKIRPTHLLYKSNLAHNKMKLYVNELIEKELIKEDIEDGKKYYFLTDKGIKFVDEYKKINQFVESFGL
ncbi:hypothetical protein J4440_02535 [Candidatus Woesearchaeota archaeon]|nr:hypothetical protein [Candidatus Woesearchaeota archaeon]